MSVRVNQRWPDELHARVVAAAGVRGVTRFTLGALERALEETSGPSPERSAPEAGDQIGRRGSDRPASPRESPVVDAVERAHGRGEGKATVPLRPAVSSSVRPAIPKKEK